MRKVMDHRAIPNLPSENFNPWDLMPVKKTFYT